MSKLDKVNNEESTIKSQNKKVEISSKIKQNENTKKQALIYLGPNIPGGILNNGSVYSDYPTHLKDLFEKMPKLKLLFVEVLDVTNFKKELETTGSEALRLYEEIKKEVIGGVK
jgi:hypothetical protein